MQVPRSYQSLPFNNSKTDQNIQALLLNFHYSKRRYAEDNFVYK